MYIEGRTGKWEIVIGLEVHAQIKSESKLFSAAPTNFGADPNSNVALVDAALPGMLPVLNERCVEQAVKTGLGIKAKINLKSIFDRKNYFYPDLPQGYQISQFSDPIVGEGEVTITMKDGTTRIVGVERIHIEQDAGKSLHDYSPIHTFIDLNRAGVGLMEIVSKPDLRSPEEASEYVKKLRSILRYLGTSDGDMEKGSLRCDANVSVRKPKEKLGTRCEIKNINSFRYIAKAIEYEANRQVEVLESGGIIEQETRLYDASANETRTMRTKEDAHDYRYFPDPDLVPIILTQGYIDELKASLPELPDDKRDRYVSEMGLSEYDANVIVADQAIAHYFEEVARGHDPKLAANWITVELFSRLNKAGLDIEDSPVNSAQLSGLLKLIENETISGKIAKTVFDEMFESGKDAALIVAERGLEQVTDEGAIAVIVDKVIASNTDKVEQYKSGKDKLFGFFVGQVMKESGGKANPQVVNDLLKKKLT